MKKAYIPNMITSCRIVLSLSLLFIDFRSALFILIYLICGLTDLLDSYIARRTGSETPLGARLDSIADLFMCCMIIITMMKQNQINTLIFIGIIIVFVLKIGDAVFSKIKFGKISSIHTISNKLSGLLFFFCPLTYIFCGNNLLIITGILASLASIEEFLILFTSKSLDLNRKSILSKR